jgi:hypothetical protein
MALLALTLLTYGRIGHAPPSNNIDPLSAQLTGRARFPATHAGRKIDTKASKMVDTCCGVNHD